MPVSGTQIGDAISGQYTQRGDYGAWLPQSITALAALVKGPLHPIWEPPENPPDHRLQPRVDSEASQASRSIGLGRVRGRTGGFSPTGW